MSRIKMRNPSVFRNKSRGVEKQTCDSYYESARQKMRRIEVEVSNACATCVFFTARLLLRAVALFDLSHNPELRELRVGLSRGVDAPDTTIVEKSLRSFMSTVDRSSIDFASQTPESCFVLAADHLHLAVENLIGGEYDEAQEDTVRSRSSLLALGVGEGGSTNY